MGSRTALAAPVMLPLAVALLACAAEHGADDASRPHAMAGGERRTSGAHDDAAAPPPEAGTSPQSSAAEPGRARDGEPARGADANMPVDGALTPTDGGTVDAAASSFDAAAAASCVVPVMLEAWTLAGDGGVCQASLCRADEGYEIRLSHPAGFYVGALSWTLVACDRELYIHHYPHGFLTTIAFPLTREELAALADGTPLSAFYGVTPAPGDGGQVGLRGFNCGELDKGAVHDCQ